jgi:lipopolysaccharide export system protein LptA
MTLNHWWTTLVALLLACWAGTVWAEDKAKCPCKTPEPACCADRAGCAAVTPPCCDKGDKQSTFTFAIDISLGDKTPCCDKGDKHADATAGCCAECCAECKSCSACTKEAQTTKAKTKKAKSTAGTPTVVIVPLPSLMPYPPSYAEAMPPYGFPGYPFAVPPPPPVDMAYGYACPPALPAPTPVGPVMPAVPAMPVVERIAVEHVKSPAREMVFRAMTEDGKGVLEIHTGDLCATCENLTFKSNGGAAYQLCAGNKQVHLHGASFKASADSITRVGQEERLILEGHVSLKCDRDGQHADVTAGRVVVNLAEGSFEVKPASKPAVAAPVVIPASATFEYFNGIFR